MKIFLDANICLDLLDTTRPTSKNSIAWYMSHKDDMKNEFYFSGDFITTVYYVLTQKKKINPKDVLKGIDELSMEIKAHYITHKDFIEAKNQFLHNSFDDFEDLIILNSANRIHCDKFITNDKDILGLNRYLNLEIVKP